MKVRLYKGPFSGKVYDLSDAGRNEIIIRDHKKMSREARYKAEVEAYQTDVYRSSIHKRWRPPLIEATYRICNNPRIVPQPALATPHHVYPSAVTVNTVFMHPDGSMFYEWTGWKREIPW